MSITEIKTIISQLPPTDLADLTEWFEEYQADLWDKQIEQDAVSGRLDALAEQANREFEAGRCTRRACAPFLGYDNVRAAGNRGAVVKE